MGQVVHAQGEKPPYLICRYPRSCLPTGVPVVGGNLSLLPLLFPIFDICIARAAHLIIQIQMNSCLSKQLLLSNWITDEEDSLLPGNFGTTCTSLSPKYMSFILL